MPVRLQGSCQFYSLLQAVMKPAHPPAESRNYTPPARSSQTFRQPKKNCPRAAFRPAGAFIYR